MTRAAAGTFDDFLKADSIRVQLPLSDGSTNVIDLMPQDTTLKNFVLQCSVVMESGH
jgi:hypothetical protein